MSSNGSHLVPALATASPPSHDSSPLIDPVSAGGGEGPEQVSPLKRIHQLLRGRYHWAILLAVILGGGGAVGGYFLKEPAFESVGVIRVRSWMERFIYETERSKTIPEFTAYMAAEMRALTDERVIQRALQKPELRNLGVPQTTDTINDIVERMTVKQERKEMIRVGFEDKDPVYASGVVRSVIQSYMDLYGEREKNDNAKKMEGLEGRRKLLQAEVNALRDRAFAIANETGGLDVNDEFELRRKTLYDIQTQIRQIEMELAERGVDPTSMQPPKSVGEMTLEEMAQRDPGVLGVLIAKRRDLEAQMSVLRDARRLGPQHREVRVLQAVIDDVNTRIAERVQQLVEGEAVAANRLDDPLAPHVPFSYRFKTTDELNRLLQKFRADEELARVALMEISQKKNQLDQLKEEIENSKRQLADTRVRIMTLEVEINAGQDRISVLSEGTSPTKPSNGGKRKQLAALGGMAGASLGVSIVLLFGLADPRLRTIDDARTGLYQARMLGILPSLPEDLSDPQQASIAAHCVHHIRTMLQVGVTPDQHRVYSVTSPGAGTGKTSLTLALGLSFAASDSRTLLIDCDLVGGGLTRRVAAVVRRRIGHLLQKHGLVTPQQIEEALHVAQERQIRLGEALIELGYIQAEALDRVLNLQEQSLLGVMDACNGEPFDHCIAETGVKNLCILPTGTAMARHAASLSPGAVSRLVAQARAKFDIVLIDTGPILGSLEASVVAGTVDGTVLIVSRGDHRAVCDKSVEYLQSIRANLLGIVFNRAEVHDFERSSFTSLASLTSLRPNDGEVVEGEIIDGEASSRLGPVGSAVATTSRIARNGRGRHS